MRSDWVQLSRAAGIAMLVALCLQLVYISRYDWNPAALIGMPKYLADDVGDVSPQIPIFANGGHDGGYVYVFARSPFRVDANHAAFHVERPLFPLTAWALALGHVEWLPYSMPLVNLLATGMIAIASGISLRRRGMNPGWALVCALGPGLAMPLRFNLVDQYVLAWICLAFVFFDQKKHAGGSLCLALSILARPMSLGAAGVAVCAAWMQNTDRRPAMLYALSPMPYLGWRVFLAAQLDYPLNIFTGGGAFAVPVLSFLTDIQALPVEGSIDLALLFGTAGFYFLMLVAALRRAWLRGVLTYEVMLIVGYAAAVLSLPQTLGGGPVQWTRLTPIFPFVVYTFAAERALDARLVMLGVLGLSLFGMLWLLGAPVMT